jgi:hypothetical protein
MSKKKCFVISPIGEDGSDTRKRADQVLKHVIKPAAEECGFDAIRADDIAEPGLITSQVIQRIIDDPLVVADLTGMNPNVFYELAIRHSIRKPLVQIIQKGDKIPFDVAGMRTVSVDHKDLDSVDEARAEIVKQIKAVADKKPEEIDSPISVSVELQFLKHSENPEERSYADFISAVSDLRKDISLIEKKLSSPSSLIPPEYLAKLMDRPSMARTREYEMMMEEMVFRLRKLVKMGGDKKSSMEMEHELERLEHMMLRMRHDIG